MTLSFIVLISSHLHNEVGPSSTPPNLFHVNMSNEAHENLLPKQVFNPTKRKLTYNCFQNFQDVWIVHLLWEKSMLNEQGLVHQVCFRLCTFVDGKYELLASKLDSL